VSVINHCEISVLEISRELQDSKYGRRAKTKKYNYPCIKILGYVRLF
jgi:hypothetical protein